MEFTYALRFEFTATNNEAEYEALIAGLRIAARMGVRNLEANVDSCTMQVPRGDNKKADALSKIASTSFAHLSKQVLVEILKNKSISEMEISTVIEEQDPTPHDAEIRTSKWCPLSTFVPTTMAPMRRTYSGRLCAPRDSCGFMQYALRTTICSIKSLTVWGIDIAGPFPVAAGGLKFLIVAIDYFTKWIEAKAVATITGNQVKRFVWDNIVCRFGLPGEIVSDNGKQFCDNPFKDWCARLSITQRFASVKHPQTNGLVERANRSLGEGIKARLDRHKGRWVEELSQVLWAHRTTKKVSTGDTPFSLVYGTRAHCAGLIHQDLTDTGAGALQICITPNSDLIKDRPTFVSTIPMDTEKPLLKDSDGDDVDVHLYRSMIGSLMYLTSSRPDIMFAVCACARFQVTPKVSHSHAVKRIFRYLKGQPKLGLWYPRNSPFDLVAYSDSDYAGASLDRKSTTGGCQFLGCRLISWQCKKQTVVATSSTEAEYVAAASCCGQVLWIQNQMLDYGYNFMHTMINIDNNSTICIVKNPVSHTKTKHIEIRYHFIRDCNDKKLIQVVKIHTDNNFADLLTKALDVGRISTDKQIECLKLNASPLKHVKRGRDTKIPQSSGPPVKVCNEAVHKELGDRMERVATTISSLEAKQDSGNINMTQSMATLNDPSP
ncbi:putative ribonuclease H-like domain-containing protein [Tanacetum coccineum]